MHSLIPSHLREEEEAANTTFREFINSNSMSTEEQLISFFAYSFLIYPITNYLVSPHRKYKRFYGVLYAIAFLGIVSYLHMVCLFCEVNW